MAEGTSEVPSWFSDLKTPRPAALETPQRIDFDEMQEASISDLSEKDLLPSRVGSRSGSRRSSGLRETPVSQETNLPPKLPSSRGSRRNPRTTSEVDQTTSEIRRSEKIELTPTPSNPKAKAPIKKSRREMQEDDHSLRQSLDALNDSDRKNRGRLQQELTTVVISGRGADHHLHHPSGSDADDDPHTIPLEATVAVNMRMQALETLSGGVLDQEMNQTNNVTTQKQMLRQRSERIDKVQEKVSSALASLAGMMSSLPGGGGGGSKSSNSESKDQNRTEQHAPVSQTAPRALRSQFSDPLVGGSESAPAPSTSVATADDEISKIMEMVNGLDMEMSTQSVFVPQDLHHQQRKAGQSSPIDLESSLHETPLFPQGTFLEIVILSTWGDPYYVGLNGIDLFDRQGHILRLNQGIKSISSTPSDINILPEYHDDPRTILNLLDEVNFTRDDLHVWLAPHGSTLTPKLPHVASITIEFEQLTTLSMIRIWNFNKSRTHCYRGVRQVQISLNSRVLYEGTIRMAPGLLSSADDCSDLIVFCNEKSVFKRILDYDTTVGYQLPSSSASQEPPLQFIKEGKRLNERPKTADKRTIDGVIPDMAAEDEKIVFRKKHSSSQLPFEKVVPHSDGPRPTTSAIRPCYKDSQPKSTPLRPLSEKAEKTPWNHQRDEEEAEAGGELVECQTIKIVIEKTWGDICYVGLAGLEILTGSHRLIAPLLPHMIDASPRDLSAIGFFDDPRTPDKLIDGVNDTTDDTHMWLIPYTKGSTHILKIQLDEKIQLAGFHFWNYNKSPGDALRGVRLISVYADTALLGVAELRLGPGCDGIEFKQTLLVKEICGGVRQTKREMNTLRYITPAVRQDYEVPLLPSGTSWKITFHSNWGDGYYIGLDGLELLDEKGEPIPLGGSSRVRILATPDSLRDLGMQDSRVPSNLATQPYSDPSGLGSWLAPLAQCMTETERLDSLKRFQQQQGRGPLSQKKKSLDVVEEADPFLFDENILFLFFDTPVTVSVIRSMIPLLLTLTLHLSFIPLS
jgi:protein JBTS26